MISPVIAAELNSRPDINITSDICDTTYSSIVYIENNRTISIETLHRLQRLELYFLSKNI